MCRISNRCGDNSSLKVTITTLTNNMKGRQMTTYKRIVRVALLRSAEGSTVVHKEYRKITVCTVLATRMDMFVQHVGTPVLFIAGKSHIPERWIGRGGHVYWIPRPQILLLSMSVCEVDERWSTQEENKHMGDSVVLIEQNCSHKGTRRRQKSDTVVDRVEYCIELLKCT